MGTLHKDLIDDDNHAVPARTYADVAARDADVAFQVAANVDKFVKVESPPTYYVLVDTTPTWAQTGSVFNDQWKGLTDTPASISANLAVQGNAAGTDLEFGQNLTPAGDPTFNDLRVNGELQDSTGDGGTAGQTMVSTGSGIDWESREGSNTVHVFDTADWGSLETAPDGEQRVKLVDGTTYMIHATHVMPMVWMPEIPDPTQFNVINFDFVNASIELLCEAGDTAGAPAQIWGRNMGGLLVKDGIFVDIADSENGLKTTLFDCVGAVSNSIIAFQFSVAFGFKRAGNLVNMFWNVDDCLFEDNLGGITCFISSGFRVDNLIRVTTFRSSPGFAMEKPAMSFMGIPNTNQVAHCTVDLQSGEDFVYLDSALVSSSEIVGNPYPGPASGDFFAESEAIAITDQAADDVAFASVAAGDPGFSVITFASIQDFTVGQTVLVDGDTGSTYDGLHEITAVSDDQKSFTIEVTFVATDTGNFRMVKHTVASHPFVRNATIVITDTSNNGTFAILRETDTSFNTPALFAAGDLVGTATSNPLGVDTVGVKTLSNGAQQDSKAIAFGYVNGNASATTITDGVYAAINSTGMSEDASTSRFTLTTPATGLWTYNDVNPLNGFLTANIWATKAGSTADYRFALSINGAIPVFASAPYGPMEIKTTKVGISVTFAVSIEQNDTVQIMSAGDGTGDNLTVTDLIMSIS